MTSRPLVSRALSDPKVPQDFSRHAHTHTHRLFLAWAKSHTLATGPGFRFHRRYYNFFSSPVSSTASSAPQGIDLESELWSLERQHTRALQCLPFNRRCIDPSLRCRFIIIIIHFHVLLSLPRLPCSLSRCWWLWWLAAGEGQNCFGDRGPRPANGRGASLPFRPMR